MRASQDSTNDRFAPSGFSEVEAAGASRGQWRGLLSWFDAGNGYSLFALLAILLMLNIAASFPGTMMNDSVNQYAEAVSGKFTDWHPPVMAWLWSKLRLLDDGPAPLFLAHMVAYWSAIGLLADAMRRLGRRHTAVLVALAGAFPPFIFMNANVIKDVGMAVSLLCGVALVFWFRSQGRRLPLGAAVLAALLLAYGTLVRTNAVFALGPLLVFAFAPASWMRSVRLVIASLVIAVLAVPLSQKLNELMFKPQPREAIASLLLYDIAGVAAQQDDPSILQPRAQITRNQLARCYSPFWWDSFSAWGACSKFVNRPDNDHATYSQGLSAQWLKTVLDHPGSYLVHRLKHFNSEVMFAVPLKHLRLAPEYRGDMPESKPFEVFSPANVRLDLVRKNPTVWPVTWLVWGGVLLLFLARCTPTTSVLLARALVLSALAYTGAYFFIGVATDIRYHYWSMLATLLATLAVLPQITQGLRVRSPLLTGGLGVLGVVVAMGLVTRLLDFQGWVL